MSESDGTSFETASVMAPRWKRCQSIALVHHLNEHCLELLAGVATVNSAIHVPLVSENRELWSRLSPVARRRAALMPFVILDLHFTNERWWRRVIEAPSAAVCEPGSVDGLPPPAAGWRPERLPEGVIDLVLAASTFDNVPTFEKKTALFRSLKHLLWPSGRIVTVVSSPDIYLNEWASFSTKDFPENRTARCGDTVRIVMLDVPDQWPVEDILWTAKGYQDVYEAAGLVSMETHRPLADPAEPFPWDTETTVAPWVVYVLAPA